MAHEFNTQLSKLNRKMSALVADLNELHTQRAEVTGKRIAEYDTKIVDKLCAVEQTANHIANLVYDLLAEA